LSSTPSPSGFSAEIFQKGSEIVISFQGTNPDGISSDGRVDWISNIALGAAWATKQLHEAALVYQRVRAHFDGATITFTGHSLGGGLAGLMAFYFDRRATVFAPAPLEPAANIGNAQSLRTTLIQAGFNDDALNTIADAVNPDVLWIWLLQREAAVSGYFINGEAVDLIRSIGNTIANWPLTTIDIGNSDLGTFGRHSMQLHAAALESVALRNASIALPQLLTFIADSRLFAQSLANDEQKDLLQRLLEYQFAGPSVMANGLNRFAEDANRLGARLVSGSERVRSRRIDSDSSAAL
jgi:hypothetical protein